MSTQPTGAGTRLVRRNTFHLVLAQVLVLPLTFATNALIARFLGSAQFGQLYIATTFASFGFLFVEAGQGAALAGLVASARARAGLWLGSSLLWRALTVLPVSLVLIGVAAGLGNSQAVLVALALMLLVLALGTITQACYDTLRGFERADIAGFTFVAWKLLIVVVMVPVLVLGGGLRTLLLAQAACTALGAVAMLAVLRRVNGSGLSASREAVQELLNQGGPFLLLALVLALQENVDAAFLGRLASPAAVGWFAVSRKLVGLLVYPANALTVALFPTLSRLRAADPDQFRETAASALRSAALLCIPVGLGCLLFPQLGVWVFSSTGFEPANTDLRVLSLYLLLVYFSMPLSTLLMVGNRRRPWILLQLGCVALSVLLDPWLIPLFQSRLGNGGLGVCVSTVVAELLMVAGGMWLAPRDLFDRRLLRAVAVAVTGGIAMLGVALALRTVSGWVVAPLALLAYALVQFAIGGLRPAAIRRIFRPGAG